MNLGVVTSPPGRGEKIRLKSGKMKCDRGSKTKKKGGANKQHHTTRPDLVGQLTDELIKRKLCG